MLCLSGFELYSRWVPLCFVVRDLFMWWFLVIFGKFFYFQFFPSKDSEQTSSEEQRSIAAVIQVRLKVLSLQNGR